MPNHCRNQLYNRHWMIVNATLGLSAWTVIAKVFLIFDDIFSYLTQHFVCCFLYRLEAYDRNKNFQDVMDIQLPPSAAVCWPSDGFAPMQPSHHTLIHRLNQHAVRSYFCYRQALDLLSEANIQALEKGQLLLDSGRVVEACSVCATGVDVFLPARYMLQWKRRCVWLFVTVNRAKYMIILVALFDDYIQYVHKSNKTRVASAAQLF